MSRNHLNLLQQTLHYVPLFSNAPNTSITLIITTHEIVNYAAKNPFSEID